MKTMYVDIGELGWSLYLVAHVRWLKQHTDDYIGVMTHADRFCLYRGVADAIYEVPEDFRILFKRDTEVYFGLKGTSIEALKDYFTKQMSNGYELKGYFGRWKGFRDKTIFKPYAYNKKLNGNNEILIFPRYRKGARFNRRNLPEEFYVMLINTLCDKFPDFNIRTIGLIPGSYSMNIVKENYINSVSGHSDLQDLIDYCQVATCAIGGTSAPPKITLLQGVPTFIIGHEKVRFTKIENWMETKSGFYSVEKRRYSKFDFKDCITKITSFIEEVRSETIGN